MSYEDTHNTTSLGIPYPLWEALIANRSALPENLRLDIELLAKAADRELVSAKTEIEKKVDLTDSRMPFYVDSGDPNDLGHFNDASGVETWLGVDARHGGPRPTGERILRDMFRMFNLDDPEFMLSVLDDAYHRTDMTLDNRGQFADFVVARLAPRIADHIGGGGGGAGFSSIDRYMDGSTPKRMFTDATNIGVAGSSTFEFIFPYLEAEFEGKGRTFHSWAKNGERIEHINARLGVTPALLTVTGGSLPASGPVTVTASNMPASGSLKPFDGVLNGVHGTLSSTGSVITFTRTTAGSATSVPAGTPFIPDLQPLAQNYTMLYDAGKNNMLDPDVSGFVFDETVKAFKSLVPFVKRFLVGEKFVHSNQAVGSAQYQNVYATNARLADYFGDALIPINQYILSAQIWADTGITPTSDDLQKQADGIKPMSISSDAGHLNADGYTAVAKFILAHFIRVGII